MDATRRLPDPEERPILPIAEAGALAFNLGRAASYNAARRGDLPTIRVGNRLWVPTALLRAKLGLPAAKAS